MNINRIVTHHNPHFDELLGIWLLKKYGQDLYSGVENAEVIFVDAGSSPFDGLSVEAWEKKGTLAIGVWGGRFDEHSSEDCERVKDACAAMLVAEDLGVAKDPALAVILVHAFQHDQKGVNHRFAISSMVSLLNRTLPFEKVQEWIELALEAKVVDPRKKPSKDFTIGFLNGLIALAFDFKVAMNWSRVALEALYQKDKKFFGETAREFKQAEVKYIKGPSGQNLRLVSAVLDDDDFLGYALSPEGNCDIVVIQQSTGNTQIFTKSAARLLLVDLIRLLRLEEQAKKKYPKRIDWEVLESEGSNIPEVPEWYIHHKGGMILNGSHSTTDVPPTQISLKRIVELIRVAMDGSMFPKSMAVNCQKGICKHTKKSPCKWHFLGLKRCRTIRFNQQYANTPTPTPATIPTNTPTHVLASTPTG